MNWFRKRKPAAPSWDGNHNLKYVLWEQFFGSSPDDYRSGWVWKCSCGTGAGLPLRFAFAEARALAEFKAHAVLYQEEL